MMNMNENEIREGDIFRYNFHSSKYDNDYISYIIIIETTEDQPFVYGYKLSRDKKFLSDEEGINTEIKYTDCYGNQLESVVLRKYFQKYYISQILDKVGSISSSELNRIKNVQKEESILESNLISNSSFKENDIKNLKEEFLQQCSKLFDEMIKKLIVPSNNNEEIIKEQKEEQYEDNQEKVIKKKVVNHYTKPYGKTGPNNQEKGYWQDERNIYQFLYDYATLLINYSRTEVCEIMSKKYGIKPKSVYNYRYLFKRDYPELFQKSCNYLIDNNL